VALHATTPVAHGRNSTWILATRDSYVADYIAAM
jgi:hypothetical protein